MKKLSHLPLLLITVLFVSGIIYLSNTDFFAKGTVSLGENHTQATSASTNYEISSNGKININTATKETLSLLNGIGETLAERIIFYRQENGPYADINDLLNVKGIGEAKLSKIAPFITAE